MAYIALENVSYTYPLSEKPALNNISMQIERGEFVAIVGSNTSGKTTLLNAIRGFIPHFFKGELSGSIQVDNTNPSEVSLAELAEKIGYVFQNPFTQISGVKNSVYDELAYGLENLGIPRDEMQKRIEEMLTQANIQHLRDKNPFELSGGQQQRVALASILVMAPDILLIDEPTSQLDPQSAEAMFALIHQAKLAGKTILLIEHNTELIAEFADRVVVLSEGQIVLDDKTHTVLTHPDLERFNVRYPPATKLVKQLIAEKQLAIDESNLPITTAAAKALFNQLEIKR